MSNTLTRVAVVGCGVISKNHLYALNKLTTVQLVAVCDIVEQKAKDAADAYGCRYYTDYHEMFVKEKPDVVHICLPHYLHAPVAIEAMEMGIDVLCEKPMHKDLEGARRMKEVSLRTGRRLGVIFQNRYNSGCRLAKKVLVSGELGKVKGVCGTVMWNRDDRYYASGPWRASYETAGGGVIINQAIHTLDLVRWFADSDVEDVHATVSHHGETHAEVEDTAEGVIYFKNGIKGLFFFSINNVCDEQVQVSVYCEKGKIQITGTEAVITLNNGEVLESTPSHETFYGAKSIYGVSHVRQIAHFYRPGNEAETTMTMEEALKTQELIDMIFKSSAKSD